MKIELIDEASDIADVFEIKSLAREKGGLVLSTSVYTILIHPFDDLAEAIVDLVDASDLPESKSRNKTLDEELTQVLMNHLPA